MLVNIVFFGKIYKSSGTGIKMILSIFYGSLNFKENLM